jgi:peptide/nickel transport system permease protein
MSTTQAAEVMVAGDPEIAAHSLRGGQWRHTVRNAMRLQRTRIGLGITLMIVAVALFGPLVAPYSPTALVARPNTPPNGELLLGADSLGRDVLSRFLNGGRSVIGLSLASGLLGVGAGVIFGLVAAYSRGWLDDVLMRANDVVLAFPQIIFALLAVAMFGPNLWLLVIAIAITHAPRTARVIRGAAIDVVESEFIKEEEAVGEKRWRILFGDVLPNVSSPLLVELGLRITYSVWLVAGLSFLGFGLQPPSADWGLMIEENRLSISVQPWAVIVPAFGIGLLTIGTNLVTDGIARAAIGVEGRGHE